LSSERKEAVMKTIVLATDGSPTSEKATEVAIELAVALGTRLQVVSCWRYPVTEYAPLIDVTDLGVAQRKHAETTAKRAVARASDAHLDAFADVREGFPAAEICAAAEDSHADLVVMGAHGWGPLKRFLVGSVSTTVLHHAPCAVLIVREGAPEDADKTTLAGTAAGAR
jgi:nucleotide-binding universal stress UspA family protein